MGLINYGVLIGTPVHPETQGVSSMSPRNTIRHDEAVNEVRVVLRVPVRCQALQAASGETDLRKNRAVGPVDTQLGRPIRSVRRTIYVVVVNPVEPSVQVIQQARAENVIPADTVIIRDERVVERAVVQGRRKIGGTIDRFLIAFAEGKKEFVFVGKAMVNADGPR